MDFTEINSRGKRGELLGRIDRQNSRFRTAKTITIKVDLHASFVELESAKNALNQRIPMDVRSDEAQCFPVGVEVRRGSASSGVVLVT
ncbi:hypothetical protein TNCV_2140271 [Trichonephila clavipes]|uniref:Uncharacterized protein n=1 Tax=Trichonephila clavipes TaxID=2585209 RepID=A0A8X6S515_TRICX|nr:hypothetical protein TNCV_2140271 [Trichonephila clavipes]